MRTTVTFDPDVSEQIRRAVVEEKLPLKRIVNDVLRLGLAARGKQKPARFVAEPLHLGRFKPGIDVTKLGQLLNG